MRGGCALGGIHLCDFSVCVGLVGWIAVEDVGAGVGYLAVDVECAVVGFRELFDLAR